MYIIVSSLVLGSASLTAQDIPGQYREKFSESFPIREQQHLELKAYIDNLVKEKKDQSISKFTPDFPSRKITSKKSRPIGRLLVSFSLPGLIAMVVNATFFLIASARYI